MKKVLALFFVLISSFYSFSQDTTALTSDKAKVDTAWTYAAVTTITFSQISFYNWSAGGENSYSLNGIVSLSANYAEKRTTWENSLDIGYGIIHQSDRAIDPTRKSDDKIDFSSKFGYKTKTKFYWSGLLSFKSQMDEGYQYTEIDKNIISNALAPGYLLAALGLEYKPSKKFYVLGSPATLKTTFVLDDTLSARGAFGVEDGNKVRAELGGYAKIAYENEIMKNVKLKTKLDLFSNYLNNPENIDVNCEILVSMKINKFLSSNLSSNLIYDEDVDIDKDAEHKTHLQLKEVFGVGLSIKF